MSYMKNMIKTSCYTFLWRAFNHKFTT